MLERVLTTSAVGMPEPCLTREDSAHTTKLKSGEIRGQITVHVNEMPWSDRIMWGRRRYGLCINRWRQAETSFELRTDARPLSLWPWPWRWLVLDNSVGATCTASRVMASKFRRRETNALRAECTEM